MSEPTALRPSDPRKVGGYRLRARLGAGGMGTVYLAEGPHRSQVALKVVHASLVGVREFQVRFQREVAAMQRVGGECAVRVHDACVEGPTLWVAMDYVVGPTLHEQIERHGPLDSHSASLLALGLAEALAAIHAAGLVHRDLKPGNLILSPDGPRVLDFGIARALDATSLTATGTVLGTVAWMAPEQLRGDPENPASDIFAWGCIVAYAATGAHPFGAGRSEAVALRILSDAPELESLTMRAECLSGLVAQALNRIPDERPSAQVLIRALLGLSAASDPTIVDASLTRALSAWQSGDATAPPSLAAARPRRRVAAALLAIAAVALAAAVTGGLMWPSKGSGGVAGALASPTATGTSTSPAPSRPGTTALSSSPTEREPTTPPGLHAIEGDLVDFMPEAGDIAGSLGFERLSDLSQVDAPYTAPLGAEPEACHFAVSAPEDHMRQFDYPMPRESGHSGDITAAVTLFRFRTFEDAERALASVQRSESACDGLHVTEWDCQNCDGVFDYDLAVASPPEWAVAATSHLELNEQMYPYGTASSRVVHFVVDNVLAQVRVARRSWPEESPDQESQDVTVAPPSEGAVERLSRNLYDRLSPN